MDEEGFHAFYEQTSRNLRAYLHSMVTESALVDDLLQETYFRYLKAALPASMEPAHRKNYLYRIATNLIRDHRRSRSPEQLTDELALRAPAGSPDAAHDIGSAFARLKPGERDALWLAYVECFSHREMAEILRIGTASVRPTLARARAKFADILRRRGLGD